MRKFLIEDYIEQVSSDGVGFGLDEYPLSCSSQEYCRCHVLLHILWRSPVLQSALADAGIDTYIIKQSHTSNSSLRNNLQLFGNATVRALESVENGLRSGDIQVHSTRRANNLLATHLRFITAKLKSSCKCASRVFEKPEPNSLQSPE